MADESPPYFLSSAEIRNTLSLLGQVPRKQFGQSFLASWPAIERIIDLCELSADDEVLEIGPGLGALTLNIARKVKLVHAIEINQAFCQYLGEKEEELAIDNISIENGDALVLEFPSTISKIISAVPYSISAPLIFKILEFSRQRPVTACLIFQKEFAVKLLGKPGTANYNRISASVSLFAECNPLMELSKNNFFPVPDVDSLLVKLSPISIVPDYLADACIALVNGLFPYKNKVLKKAMEMHLKKIAEIRIIPSILDSMPLKEKRVRELGRDEFIQLAGWYSTATGG
ncbi:MAG TPA: 16S rRNA (adenine(1518)-N(6)/adenine(1519)-N(6))-dimethyltransferase RsmA [Candidatus Lokiarchaeia archaeon]|nr:16S rRNA (adenine(1518)-N(6)/adenine(1519)-N(6))-dimethyltransferase RsmA [Candidatus Lokiarchaeia archaeon]